MQDAQPCEAAGEQGPLPPAPHQSWPEEALRLAHR